MFIKNLLFFFQFYSQIKLKKKKLKNHFINLYLANLNRINNHQNIVKNVRIWIKIEIKYLNRKINNLLYNL
jgi:hypothetical protein